MCKVLKVSESGYYRWLKKGSKPRSWQLLLVEINKIFAEHPDNDNYGVERVKTALGLKGIKASKSKIYRAMKAGGLIHRCRKSHGITKADTETQDRDSTATEAVSTQAMHLKQCTISGLWILP